MGPPQSPGGAGAQVTCGLRSPCSGTSRNSSKGGLRAARGKGAQTGGRRPPALEGWTAFARLTARPTPRPALGAPSNGAFPGCTRSDTGGGEHPPVEPQGFPLRPRVTPAQPAASRGLPLHLQRPGGWLQVGDSPRPVSSVPGSCGKAPGEQPPQPADLGRTAGVHLPRTTAPAWAPEGPRPARLPRSPAARSSPGSGCPAAEPWSCGPSGAPASPPLAAPAPLGPPVASAPGTCSPSASLRSRGGGLPPAPLGVWPADLVARARRGGPGGSCSPRRAAAGASTGGAGLRPAARVTSSSPGVSVSCTWMASLGQGNPRP